MKLISDRQARSVASLPWRCVWLGYMIGFLAALGAQQVSKEEYWTGFSMMTGACLLLLIGRLIIVMDNIRPDKLKDAHESVSRLPKSK